MDHTANPLVFSPDLAIFSAICFLFFAAVLLTTLVGVAFYAGVQYGKRNRQP